MLAPRLAPHRRLGGTTGLVIIDPQVAFTRGQWAALYGARDVAPLLDAFRAIRRRSDEGCFAQVPVLVTLAPFDDAPPADVLSADWLSEPRSDREPGSSGAVRERRG